MIMRLTYEFIYIDKKFTGFGVDVGDTDNLEQEAQDKENLKTLAICHAFSLTSDDEREINAIKSKSSFKFVELEV